VLRGLGVGLAPRYLVEELITAKAIVPLLIEFKARPMPLNAVYPASRRRVARVGAVVQALLRHLQPQM